MGSSPYLTIEEACAFLGISRPTFNKIRKQRRLKEFLVGKRARFLREDIEGITRPVPVSQIPPDRRIDLTIFSESRASELEVEPNTFDLRKVRSFDPRGVLDVFCTCVHRARQGHAIRLLVEDNFVCNHLRSLGFFLQLQKAAAGAAHWEADLLRTDYEDVRYPIGLAGIAMSKEEAPVLDRLIRLLREQGFSEASGGYIGWIYGELIDNATTHLVHSGELSANPDCYLLAQRFKFAGGRSDCLIIGVADVGPGIHATLKRNPKYSQLSDTAALLTAFKANASSWPDEYNRGKGLTDILSIAMGNKSVFRAESGCHNFYTDFRGTGTRVSYDEKAPAGTRVSLVLIDHAFEVKETREVGDYIDRILGES